MHKQHTHLMEYTNLNKSDLLVPNVWTVIFSLLFYTVHSHSNSCICLPAVLPALGVLLLAKCFPFNLDYVFNFFVFVICKHLPF